MVQVEAPILDNAEVASGHFLMDLEAPDAARSARPGQFVMVRVTGAADPFLRRPLSIHAVHDERVGLLYRTVGRGTRLLSLMRPGARLDVLGPLGRGFTVPDSLTKALLVGGGVGVAPLLFLAQWLRARCAQAQVDLVLGAGSAGGLLRAEAFRALGVELYTVTEDGSSGEAGLATDVAGRILAADPDTRVYACGPRGMLDVLRGLVSQYGVPAEGSLECHMGCGLGVCRGCAVRTRQGYAHVCADGPVFPLEMLAEEVPW